MGRNLDVINQVHQTINDGIQFLGELRIHKKNITVTEEEIDGPAA
jgi:hypothetical protein